MKTFLKSERLLLEPFAVRDVSAVHQHWTEADVRRYLWDGRVIDRQQVDEIVEGSDALFDEIGAGLWTVRSSSGSFVGTVGFWRFHDPPELELVVSVSPDRWGRGIATEASTRLIDFAFSQLNWSMIQASTDEPNERSLKLIDRLGMKPVATRPGPFGSTEVFRISRAEWTEQVGPVVPGRPPNAY